MDNYFSSRHSVRKFINKPIERNLLNDILKAAMRAPTTGNMQLYSIIITQDAERKAILAEQHFNQPASVNAPVILTICADFNRFTRWCEISGANPGYNNFLSFLSAATDAIILAQQITTIAEKEGLGTCYLGTVTYNAPEISDLLHLPDLVIPVASLAIGYPENEAIEPTERLPLEAWVHDEEYRNDSDERIMELMKAKDDFEPNKKYVSENNMQSLAQVFTDIRYPESMNLAVSEKLINLLKQKNLL